MWAEILPKNFDAYLAIFFFKIRKFYTFLGIKFLDVIGSDIFPAESKNMLPVTPMYFLFLRKQIMGDKSISAWFLSCHFTSPRSGLD